MRVERTPARGSRLLVAVVLVGLPIALVGLRGEPTARPPFVLDRPAVIAAFISPDRERVQRALAQVRRVRPAPIEWLRDLLTDPRRGAREWAAHALGDLACAEPGVVRALIRAFDDEDDYVRWKAARALGRIGPPARAALPLLERVAAEKQEVEVVRATAQAAVALIRGVGPSSP